MTEASDLNNSSKFKIELCDSEISGSFIIYLLTTLSKCMEPSLYEDITDHLNIVKVPGHNHVVGTNQWYDVPRQHFAIPITADF